MSAKHDERYTVVILRRSRPLDLVTEMSGSLLGRGRGGRLAVYGGCGVVVVLLIFLYRAATSEMARLQELHVQCAHQQEALAAQLQVIFEYKVRLEKSLAEEKSSNAAVRQELQQRATREKSLRDKDSIEAMQRYNSLQQMYKLLQTEHQDLQDECKKREKLALEDKNRLESTLQDLRGHIRQAQEDKKKELEHLKNKHLELEDEKTRLEARVSELLKTSGNSDSTIDHLRKEVIQLKRELDEAKRYQNRVTSPNPSLVSPQSSQQADPQQLISEKSAGSAIKQPIQPSQQQQQQSTAPTSSMRAVPAMKPESSTRSNNPLSTSSEKLSPARSMSKVKIPAGVLPIPPFRDQKIERPEERLEKEGAKRKEENPPVKNVEESKEKEQAMEPGNLDPPFVAMPAGRHVGQQILDRRGNEREGWFRVAPGVQEIGDELNHLGRIPGFRLDEAADGQGDGDHQYEGDYDNHQQKNNYMQLEEGEDEGEDEDDQLDYPHNVKQEKRE